ncbi:GAF domain-containing protein [Myxococcaceae bacterium GXIMD 01537]
MTPPVPRPPELQTLARFSELTRETGDLDALLKDALGFIASAFGAAWVALLGPEGELLRPCALHAEDGGEARAEALAVAAEATRSVLATHEGLALEDVLALAGGAPAAAGRTRSVLAEPLRAGPRVPGVLCLGTAAPQAFSADARLLLTLMAERLALPLDDARIHEADRRAHAQLESVRSAALLLAEPQELRTTLQRIVEQARAIASADYSALGIVNEAAADTFEPWVFSGVPPQHAMHIGRPPRPVGLLGEVPATGVTVRLEHIEEDPRFQGLPREHPRLDSFLGVPIAFGGRRVGNLYLGRQPGAPRFTEEDERAVALLAQHAAVAVESARLHERTLGDMEELKRAHTALQQSEERLRNSESLLRLVLENLPVGVWISDASGTIVEGNPASQRIWGGARYVGGERLEEYKGWWARDGQRITAKEWAVSRAVHQGETSIGEVVHIETFDGKRKTILNSAVPVRDAGGTILGALVVNEDVTDRMRAESELRLLAEASEVLSASLDLDATLRAVARLTVRFLGDGCVVHLVEDGQVRLVATAHKDAALDTMAQELLRHPTETLALLPALAASIESGQPCIGEIPTEVLNAPPGDPRFAEVVQALAPHSYIIAPLTTRNRVLGAITFGLAQRDRHYEQRDLAPARELGRRAALAIENAQLNAQTQRAMQLRKEVLAVVSHDLRNPLGSISLRLLALERRAARNGDTPTEQDAQVLQRSARQMERLIADLLDMASIDAGRLTVRPQAQDVCGLLSEAMELLAPLGESCGVRVELLAPAPSFKLRCDRARIVQVLSNLAGNALKFTPSGGSVSLRASLDGDRAVISVHDTGGGIPAEELPHVFDRYWRARSAEKTTRGVGLGLAIVKGIIESHGGEIRAESALGQGSTFTFTLPLSGPPDAPPSPMRRA